MVAVQGQRKEPPINEKVHSKSDNPDDRPAHEIHERDSEIHTWVRIAIDASKKPAVATKRDGINDHVDDGEKRRR